MTILNMVGGGGTSGPQVPLDAISIIAVVGGDTEATITWTDPSDIVVNGVTVTTWTSTKLVRKVGSAPTDSTDGTLVVTETVRDTYSVSGYNDTGLTNGTTYYYAAFAVGNNGLETISSTTPSVTPAQGGWQPGANTVAYYPLNGDAKNVVTGNNGTRNGSEQYYTLTSGLKVANCLNYDNYISGDIVTIGNGYTLSAWMYRNGGNLFVRLDTGTIPRIFYQITVDGSSGTGGGYYYNGSRYGQLDGNINGWKNVITTFDTGGVKVYVNGILIGQSSTLSFNSLTLPLDINRDRTSPYNQSGAGYYSNVIIENKVRTAQEISDYYNQTKGTYGL